MPIKIQNDLPAREILETENIFAVDENKALSSRGSKTDKKLLIDI